MEQCYSPGVCTQDTFATSHWQLGGQLWPDSSQWKTQWIVCGFLPPQPEYLGFQPFPWGGLVSNCRLLFYSLECFPGPHTPQKPRASDSVSPCWSSLRVFLLGFANWIMLDLGKSSSLSVLHLCLHLCLYLSVSLCHYLLLCVLCFTLGVF